MEGGREEERRKGGGQEKGKAREKKDDRSPWGIDEAGRWTSWSASSQPQTPSWTHRPQRSVQLCEPPSKAVSQVKYFHEYTVHCTLFFSTDVVARQQSIYWLVLFAISVSNNERLTFLPMCATCFMWGGDYAAALTGGKHWPTGMLIHIITLLHIQNSVSMKVFKLRAQDTSKESFVSMDTTAAEEMTVQTAAGLWQEVEHWPPQQQFGMVPVLQVLLDQVSEQLL